MIFSIVDTIKYIISLLLNRLPKDDLSKHQNITILEHKNSKESGEFTLWPKWPDSITSYIVCPDCKNKIKIWKNHTVTINQNGTITVNPSIIHKECGAHFWVRENKIIDA